jgi:hypothetical protein
MAGFPRAEALLALRDIDVRFVVTSSPIALPAAPSPLVERARLADGTVYELKWTPDIEIALATAIDGPLPPAAGSAPFPHAESTRYKVRWSSGPLDLPAGEIVVDAARTAAGFSLTAHATTAPWMKRFFDANDTFATETDATFLPTRHLQNLREGRRQIVRRIDFDRATRRVRVVNGQTDPVVMPLGAAARDPLSALFYARTLALDLGDRFSLPVTDAGFPVTLDVKVTGAERVRVNGEWRDSTKIEPLIRRRTPTRIPLAIALWLSRDERRVPLVLTATGDFGSVSLELVDHVTR